MRQPQELNDVFRHEVRERQEDGGGENLAGLHALQREARVIAAPSERRVLQDHRTRAGDFTRHREALDQTQDDEQRRREHADLVIGRQQADGHRRCTHQEHADQQHGFTTVGVAPVPEEERADRPRNVTDAVRRERRDDRHFRIARREEQLREDQRRGLRVDEEVVVLQRRADPAARGGLLGLLAMMPVVRTGRSL